MMTLEDRGAYITLLADSWDEDGLPADLSEVAALLGLKDRPAQFKRIWERIGPAFELTDGKYRNPRQEREREKQKEFSDRQRQRVNKRWEKDTDEIPRYECGNTGPQYSPSPSPTSSPLPTAEGVGKPKGYPPEFELLWNTYPRRFPASNKAGAFRGYRSHLKAGVAYDVMLEGVKKYAAAMIADGKVGTRYVLDAKTFFGPDKHFLNEYSDAPPDNAAAKLWGEMQRTGILLDSTTADWQRHIGEIVATGAVASREDFEGLWRKINPNVLRGSKSEKQAVEHIAAAMVAA
jgi:hypothetical protein